MAKNTYLSIITLNVSGLNNLIKRHRVAEWIKKEDAHIGSLHEPHLRTKDTHRLKVQEWKKIFNANGKERKSWNSNIYIRQTFNTRAIVRDKEGPDIMIKGTIQQEDITLATIYASNTGAPKYIKILDGHKGRDKQ